MKEYQVTAVAVTIHEGRVRMTADQARRRRHHTRPVEGQKDVFDVVRPFQFKRGETFGYDGEVSKFLMADLSAPGEGPPAGSDDPATRAAAILAAVRALDENDPKNFTNSGSPKVPVLEKALGFKVTAAERDAAWTEASKTPEAQVDEERVALIQEAIGALDPEHFDDDGMPYPKAINELLDIEVTDEEVATAAELMAEAAG